MMCYTVLYCHLKLEKKGKDEKYFSQMQQHTCVLQLYCSFLNRNEISFYIRRIVSTFYGKIYKNNDNIQLSNFLYQVNP